MRLGSHISSSGELKNSIFRAHEIGAETMQLFTSNPKGWTFRVRNEVEVTEFLEARSKAGITPVFGHMIYLVNLASNNPYIYNNSLNSLISGLILAEKADLTGVITHIGAHGGRGIKEGLGIVIQALEEVLKTTQTTSTIILETDSGAGTHLGGDFKEIGEILSAVHSNKLKVCLDTCHVYAAGYDIRSKESFEATLEEFDKYIGLERLSVVHLNDSKGLIGSNLDRHEEIGKGEIGLKAFEYIINHPSLKNLPGIVETPDNKDNAVVEKHSLDILKELRHE